MAEENYCKKYKRQYEEYGDWNLLGQGFKLLCAIEETDFNKLKEIEALKNRADNVAVNIKLIADEIGRGHKEKWY